MQRGSLQGCLPSLPLSEYESKHCLTDGRRTGGSISTLFELQPRRSPELHDRELLLQKAGSPGRQEFTAFLDLIKACGKTNDLHKGSRIHAGILRRGLLEKDLYISTALLHMYAKCGAIAKAQEVFEELQVHDVASWNALITGYSQHGHGDKAMACFERMQDEGLSPDAVTFVCILKACGSIGAVEKGEEIHVEAGRQGLLENNIVLGTAVVDMYAKCGMLGKAQEAFDRLPARDVALWNALIAGYAQHGHGDAALKCFEQMQQEGLSPGAATFVCILKACGSLKAIEKGEEIHTKACHQGLLGMNVVVGTAVVDMYVKCGDLAKAQRVFDQLPARNVVTWNALIAGNVGHGLGNEALKCFRQMQEEGVFPDVTSFLLIFKACGQIGAVKKGKDIHAEVDKHGLLKENVVLGTALVDMYVKCGVLARARQVFEELPAWDVASWTALIAGYVEQGSGDEALNCFEWMREEGFVPNAVTMVCILKACGNIGAMAKGEQIHSEISNGVLLRTNIELGNGLVEMYTSCGAMSKAQEVFDELPARTVVTWTALIVGYAQLGKVERVFDLFIEMKGACIEPSTITFMVLLSACSHAGLLEEGQWYFRLMSMVYGVIPRIEHHTCMIDLFSRAGYYNNAFCLVEELSPSGCPSPHLWPSLMSASQTCANVGLQSWALEHALKLEERHAVAYIYMSNLYAVAGKACRRN